MSQSLSDLWTHIIFSTKKRHPFLNDPTIRKRVHDYLERTCQNLNCRVLKIGGVEDHVHILLRLSKSITLSALIERVKNNSSKWIKSLNSQDIMLKKFY